jgi:hypothetical protein
MNYLNFKQAKSDNKRISKKKYIYKKKSIGNKFVIKQNNKINIIQSGGTLSYFQVYFFTEVPIADHLKAGILQTISNLYGANTCTPIDETNEWHLTCKNLIKEWVDNKGASYRRKTDIFGVNINIPDDLQGEMNDDKLTTQENRINSALSISGLPFKLVSGQPGIWNQEIAIIAFRNK